MKQKRFELVSFGHGRKEVKFSPEAVHFFEAMMEFHIPYRPKSFRSNIVSVYHYARTHLHINAATFAKRMNLLVSIIQYLNFNLPLLDDLRDGKLSFASEQCKQYLKSKRLNLPDVVLLELEQILEAYNDVVLYGDDVHQ